MRLDGRSFNKAIGWKSRVVMCNAAENVEHESYPNLSKNMMKFKRSLVLFSLFVSAIG